MSQPPYKKARRSGLTMSSFAITEADEGDDNEDDEYYEDDEIASRKEIARHERETKELFSQPKHDFGSRVDEIAEKYIQRQNRIEEYQQQQQQQARHNQQMARQQQIQQQQSGMNVYNQQLQHQQHQQQLQRQQQQISQQMQQQQQQYAAQAQQAQHNAQMAMLHAKQLQNAAKLAQRANLTVQQASLQAQASSRVQNLQSQRNNFMSGIVPSKSQQQSPPLMNMGINNNNNIPNKRMIMPQQQRQQRKRNINNNRNDDDMDNFVDDDLGWGGGDADDDQALRIEATLPTMNDPKLWLVPCMPGKERTVVKELLKKYFKYKGTNKQLFIKTAFTTDMNTSYVYVEAYQEIHVRRACEGIFGLNTYKIRIVPTAEMPNALTIKMSAPEISRGQWCRFKTGLYKGDLAQVYKVYDQGSRVVVRCIPRIDLASIAMASNKRDGGSKYNEKEKKENEFQGRRGKFFGGKPQGFAKSSGQRPPPTIFNKQQMESWGEEVTPPHKDNYLNVVLIRWQNKRFRNGFHLRQEPIRNLDFDINATEEEYSKWLRAPAMKKNKSKSPNHRNNNNESEDEDDDIIKDNQDGDLFKKPPPIPQQSCDFVRGDMVKVISGALQNLIGEVKSVQPNPVSGNVTVLVQPNHKDLHDTIPFPANQLQKYFKVGTHVKIIKGSHKDETGLIISIDELNKKCILYADLTQREITIPMNDITETSEVSTGKDVLGQYSLYELVSLSRDVVGVITQIKMNTLTILDNKASEQNVRLQDIQRHTKDKHAIALDSENNEVRIGDVVIPQLGDFIGQRCTVKHIYRQVVFCHSKACTEHSGIFVTRARLVRIADRTVNRVLSLPSDSQNNNNSKTNNNRNGQSGENAKKLRILGKMRRSARDPWMGKTIKIVSGAWKGYTGIVKRCTESTLTVELHAKMRTVPVTREQVRVKNEDGSEITEDMMMINTRSGGGNSHNRNRNGGGGNRNNRGNGISNNSIGRSRNGVTSTSSSGRRKTVPFFQANGKTKFQGNKLSRNIPSRNDKYGNNNNIHNNRHNTSSRSGYGNDKYSRGIDTPLIGAKTPAYGSGPHHHGGYTPGGTRTPGGITPGGITPGGITPGTGMGGYTPGYGGITPGYGGMTPGNNYGNEDSAWNVGAATPAHGVLTPAHSTYQGAMTPRSPAYDNHHNNRNSPNHSSNNRHHNNNNNRNDNNNDRGYNRNNRNNNRNNNNNNNDSEEEDDDIRRHNNSRNNNNNNNNNDNTEIEDSDVVDYENEIRLDPYYYIVKNAELIYVIDENNKEYISCKVISINKNMNTVRIQCIEPIREDDNYPETQDNRHDLLGKEIEVTMNDLILKTPKEDDRVYILLGKHTGQYGTTCGVDVSAGDVVISLTNGGNDAVVIEKRKIVVIMREDN